MDKKARGPNLAKTINDRPDWQLQHINREILLANGEYNELVERVEAMLRSLEASSIILRERVKKIGDGLRKLKHDLDNHPQIQA